MRAIPAWLHTATWVATAVFILLGAWKIFSKDIADAAQMWQPFVPAGVFTFFAAVLSIVGGEFGVSMDRSTVAVILPFIAAAFCGVLGLANADQETRKTLFSWATGLATFSGGVFLGGAAEKRDHIMADIKPQPASPKRKIQTP